MAVNRATDKPVSSTIYPPDRFHSMTAIRKRATGDGHNVASGTVIAAMLSYFNPKIAGIPFGQAPDTIFRLCSCRRA